LFYKLNIKSVLLKCNNLTKDLSVVFNILEVILALMRKLSSLKTGNLTLIPLLSTCSHGLVAACALCAEAATNVQATAQTSVQAAAHTAIGACTHD
jgi:hypothetical protein